VKDINWYWLSTKDDVLNWKKSKWFMTPETAYADYSALQTLDKTTLRVSTSAGGFARADSAGHDITITNTGKVVAFQVHLRALKGRDGDDILPVLFSDNYLELAPGESRTIRCSYANRDTDGAKPWFTVTAWNASTLSPGENNP
jgi:exo-1,4-beta-D-glucosaminidase